MLMSKNTQCCTFRTSNTITEKWITITQSQRTTLITDPDLAVTFAFWNFLLFLSSSAARSKSTLMNLVVFTTRRPFEIKTTWKQISVNQTRFKRFGSLQRLNKMLHVATKTVYRILLNKVFLKEFVCLFVFLQYLKM